MELWRMREEIAKVYSSQSWKQRVDRMSENQVIAVYHSFLEQGKFEKARRERTRKLNEKQNAVTVKIDDPAPHQLTFEEVLQCSEV